MGTKILIAEDEQEMQRVLTAALQMQKYEVTAVGDGEAAVEAAEKDSFDCMVFDVMMPRKDGVTALKEIRAKGDLTPVLMLTAKAEVADRIAGLDAGADDYLTKPFALGELLARIRSLTRRKENYTPTKLQMGSLQLDVEQQELKSMNAIRLGGKETKLMEYLMLNKNKPISSENILARVWDDEPDADPGVVWIYISFLRDKLKAVMSDVEIIGEEGGSFTLVDGSIPTP